MWREREERPKKYVWHHTAPPQFFRLWLFTAYTQNLTLGSQDSSWDVVREGESSIHWKTRDRWIRKVTRTANANLPYDTCRVLGRVSSPSHPVCPPPKSVFLLQILSTVEFLGFFYSEKIYDFLAWGLNILGVSWTFVCGKLQIYKFGFCDTKNIKYIQNFHEFFQVKSFIAYPVHI